MPDTPTAIQLLLPINQPKNVNDKEVKHAVQRIKTM